MLLSSYLFSLFYFNIIRQAIDPAQALQEVVHPKEKVEEYLRDNVDQSRVSNKSIYKAHIAALSSILPLVFDNLQNNNPYPNLPNFIDFI